MFAQSIAPDAFSGVRVEAVGRPTVICDGTTVSAHCIVRESFVWRGCHLEPRARVMHSVITEATTIESGRLVENQVVGGGVQSGSAEINRII